MTQEEKDLLIKDLCARLPYGVKVLNTTYRDPEIQTLFGRVSEEEFSMEETYKQVGGEDYGVVKDNVHYTGHIETIRPYLRPMSSMTKEELYVIESNFAFFRDGNWLYESIDEIVSFLNSHHFDYRGLIPMGLALPAKEGMYKRLDMTPEQQLARDHGTSVEHYDCLLDPSQEPIPVIVGATSNESLFRILAIGFMDFLDRNKTKGKMCLSNAECDDIMNAFRKHDWERLKRYSDKYLFNEK